MKIDIDPKSVRELCVLNPRLKRVGMFVLVIGLALIALDAYWPKYLYEVLLWSGINQGRAEYIVYLASYLYFICIAVGGYLMFKAREKPLQPSEQDIWSGRF